MPAWTDNDLLQLDARFAEQGIALHARPAHAALALLGGTVIEVFSHPDFLAISEAYERLIPDVSSTWPGLGIGIIASVDQIRRIVLPVQFGGGPPPPVWKILGFHSVEAYADWCRLDPVIHKQATAAATDMLDIAHTLNSIESQNDAALTLWEMARSNLEDVANVLPHTFSVATVIQPICLCVELALKALLVWDGADPESFKGPGGHKVSDFVRRITESRPHSDDEQLQEIVAALPPYVASRYNPAGLTRLAVVRLALGAQFVLASTLRRTDACD